MKRFRRAWPIALAAIAAVALLVIHLLSAQAERAVLEEGFPSTNYSVIEKDLYLGGILSEPPPGTRAVLNVCETKDPYRAEVHRWEPMNDLGPAPDLDWLRAQVKFIDQQRQAGRPLYVHCRAGINRSVTVVAAYWMWRDGLSRDDALAKVRAKRPGAGPFPVYMEYLSEWETALQKR